MTPPLLRLALVALVTFAAAAPSEAWAGAPGAEPPPASGAVAGDGASPASAPSPRAAPPGAVAPAPHAPPPDAVAPAARRPRTGAQRVAVGATAAGASLVALAAGVSTGALVPHFAFQASGRHSPAAWAGGYLLAGAATALALTFLPPLAVLLADTPDAAASARTGAFRYTRWALASAGVGFVSFCVGAGLEGAGFGRGQWAMLGGLALGILSGLAAVVLEAAGVLRSWPAERQT